MVRLTLSVQGNLELDETSNKVSCVPDNMKKGKVVESFTIRDKNVTVEHWVKNKADTIISTTVTGLKKGIKVEK